MQNLDEIFFRLGIARRIIALKEPFLLDLVLSLVMRPDASYPTLATTAEAICYFNPDYVASLDAAELAFALAHEAWHVGRRSLARRGNRDPQEWNLAGDASINGDMIAAGWKAPQGIITPQNLVEVSLPGQPPQPLPVGLPHEDYYDEIQKRKAKKPQKGPQKPGAGQGAQGPGSGQNANPGASQGPQTGPGAGRGRCGGCAGNPNPGEPKKDPEGRSQPELENAAKRAAKALQDYVQANGKGRLPAGYLVWAGAALEEPKADWREQLSCLVGSAAAWRRGHRKARYDKPNRRQGEVLDDTPIQPRRRSRRVRGAIVIDTSGSMGSGPRSALAAGVRESAAILEALNAEVLCVTCDAAVHGVGTVTDAEQIMPLLKGGGGSSFNPAFDLLERLAEDGEPYDVAIFLTDGMIDAPGSPPDAMQVIWGVVGGGSPPVPWGESVAIDI